MNGSRALLRRRPAGGDLVREARPLQTDLHPFVHTFNPAIPPPWEAKTDWDAFRRIAERVLASWPPTHLGVRRDLVAAPLLHDTPDEIAQPLRRGARLARRASASRCRAGRCRS